MSDLAKRLADLSPAQRELLERRLAKQSPPKPSSTTEPIAIVGMSCRFPGAPNIEAYWDLIDQCRDSVSEIPPSRWNLDEFFDPSGEIDGKMSVRSACLLDDVDQFDPQFFGITPREARLMDPQQRFLLEVAWETMENAGLPADRMAGSKTGVYIGIGGTDYSKVPVPYDSYFEVICPHSGTGNALSIAANRLSYIFDFHGPSMAVDTACSSSSLAVHLAVDSLHRRESDAALAGGVNLILSPEATIAFSRARMLSPEGKCRPFDASANGYVRSEGCAMVLLKRLADAQRDGDHVLAVLRGTAANQDGRTSGISAPNGQSQQACIRAAMAAAGITTNDISYIEAHGTGTPLGDPIEMQALHELFQNDETARPCYVSSVKANIGHMETASGVASLIKVVLLMNHDMIVPQTHFEKLNPNIHFDHSRLAIPTDHLPWPDGPRVAGVSSFGFGGTNTHLIVEAVEPDVEPSSKADGDRAWHLVKLSAKTEAAPAQQAEQLVDFLERHPECDCGDVAATANTGRADFHHRVVVMATSRGQLVKRLGTVAAGEKASGIKRGTVRAVQRPKLAMLFTGQGSQYVNMGRQLFDSHPRFRATLNRCDELLRARWNESLLAILYPDPSSTAEESALIHQTQYTQPALFALEYALADLWQSWGVQPHILLGHSVGEYAAACTAGVMPWEDGLTLIAERARLMQQIQQPGVMAVVFAPAERVAAVLQPLNGEVTIAAANGPENTVISGRAELVDALCEQFADEDVSVRKLQVSHAFHSPLMDEMLDDFEQFAGTITFHPPQRELVSNLTGQLMNEAPTARYWRDHLRHTVRFADGMACVANVQPTAVVEIGPSSSLLGMGRRCVPKLASAWLPSLREGQDDWKVLAGSVAEFYCRGGQIDWRGWEAPWSRTRPWLPNYPFQHVACWYEFEPKRRRLFGGASPPVGWLPASSDNHPLLGPRLSTVWRNALYETSLSAQSPVWLVDHQVQGSPVVPAAAYLEQALAGAAAIFGPGRHAVDDLSIQQAMFLTGQTRRRVQVSFSPEAGGESTFETFSRPTDEDQPDAPWTMHATGRLRHADSVPEADRAAISVDLDDVRSRAVEVTPQEEFYRLVAERGLLYGPTFQVLDDLQRTPTDALARVVLPTAVRREMASYRLHPALGDALLQSMAGAVPLEADGSFSPYTYMPVHIGRVRQLAGIDPERPLYSYARRTSDDATPSPETVEGDVLLLDAEGRPLLALEHVRVQRVGQTIAGGAADTERWLYDVQWQPQPLGAQPAASQESGTYLIFADQGGVGRTLAEKLAARGEQTSLITAGDRFSSNSSAATIDPVNEEHYAQLLSELSSQGKQLRGVVHLWSLDVNQPPDNAAARDKYWEQAAGRTTHSLLPLVRQLVRTRFPTPPHLWLITGGAQPLGQSAAAPLSVGQATLWGMGRVAALEHPELEPRLVDLDPDESADQSAEQLCQELTAAADDRQLGYRQGSRFVARLRRHADDATPTVTADVPTTRVPGEPYQLRITRPGSLDALQYVPHPRQSPADGQVEVEIQAAGLNFSDVLKALGLYPGIRDAIVPLGIEGSGVVTAVGAGVDRFAVGDEVMGVMPYAFASHARTAEYALVPKPATIDHDEACTIPITFLTAYHALVRLAHLQPGERVLIHAAAGGVGLAAIQIAHEIGAEVFATAGSDEKRQLLRSLGVQHVMNSRTLDFADEIRAATEREGVDVVLNSLPGEAITKSLESLRAYGRFLEIGKIDIYQDRKIGLLPFQDNLSYFAIDLDRMLRERPDAIRALFAEVMEYFATGKFEPLPVTRFEAEQTIAAFRYMSQRKNIGKVVVSLAGSEAESPSQPVPPQVRGDATYLITGGLGALGLRLADWLAEEGAGGIVLMSRRSPSPDVAAHIATLQERGAAVAAIQGDVADAESLDAALAQIPSDLPPVGGVIHAAGVLADGVLAEMTTTQLDAALRPKVQGAWNLHAATRAQPLDWFVMFSSVASLLGSPGQANYAAGNALLDALANYRRTLGLPATSINWGPWAETGMAASDGRDASIQARGMDLIQPAQGLELLGRLLARPPTQLAVMDVHWPDMLRLLGTRRPSLLVDMGSDLEAAVGVDSQVDEALRQQLLAADEETRQRLTREFIRDELARIMDIDAEELQTDEPLSTFGIDSLLALELKNNLEGRLAIALPMAALMEGPTIQSLARETARMLCGGGSPAVAVDEIDAGWSPLVAVRPDGQGQPLVLLPSLGGDIRCYDELVQHLPADRRVYIFRPRGLDDDRVPHASMEEMIHDYIQGLRAVQSKGPYALAGWSTAGIYAFALARGLVEAGAEVSLLALFDAPLPSVFDKVDVHDDTRFLCDVINFSNKLDGSDVRIAYEELLATKPELRFQTALRLSRRKGSEIAAPEEFIRRVVRVAQANVSALHDYHPQPLDSSVRVHLFVPESKGGLTEVAGEHVPEDADLGWRSQIGQTVDIHEVPGDHFSMMFGAGARQLAQHLAQHLSAEPAAASVGETQQAR